MFFYSCLSLMGLSGVLPAREDELPELEDGVDEELVVQHHALSIYNNIY